jgi:hypothetical protein
MSVVISLFVGVGRPICNDLGRRGCRKNPSYALVVVGDGGVMRRYLDEGIIIAVIVYPLVLL